MLFSQVLQAVHYGYSQKIFHRDIKAKNILVNAGKQILLCHFGLSVQIQPREILRGTSSTPLCIAPELWKDKPYDPLKADIWSLGVFLSLIAMGLLPFKDLRKEENMCYLQNVRLTVPGHVSKEILHTVMLLLTINPEQKPTISKILDHPWIRKIEPTPFGKSSEDSWSTLDPRIIRSMLEMGHNFDEMKKALTNQNYNHMMATYLILKH